MATTFKSELGPTKRADGRRVVMIRITHNRVIKRVGSHYFVLEKDWKGDGVEHPVKKSEVEHKTINIWIWDKLIKGRSLVSEWDREGKPITASLIKKALEVETTDEKAKKLDFFAWTEVYIDRLTKLVENGKAADSTLSGYKTAINYLRSFHRYSVLPFEEITVSFTRGFYAWLLTRKTQDRHQRALKHNTIHGIVNNLSRLLTLAGDAGHTSKLDNPFKPKFVGLKGIERTFKERLSDEELRAFAAAPCAPDSVHFHSRNIFLMNYLVAGCRISDMLMMTWEKVEWENGQPARLNFQAIKAKKNRSVKLPPMAVRILLQYWSQQAKPADFIFPLLKIGRDYTKRVVRDRAIKIQERRINLALKVVARRAGISKVISTHIARHTFARVMIERVDNVKTLMDLMGHSKLATTQIYVEEFNQKRQDEAMESLHSDELNDAFSNESDFSETSVKQSSRDLAAKGGKQRKGAA